jgi:hypothetical protein
VQVHPLTAQLIASSRPAIQAAFSDDLHAISQALEAEENEVQRQDRIYWEPLKRELEELRRRKRERG